jgi:hypothetical protein
LRPQRRLAGDDSLHVEFAVDRDTAGQAGAPDIAATIFEKICGGQCLVADVSFITPLTADGPEQKRCPNPNVLLELGYALRHLGGPHVLLVFNEFYGSEKELPFDLRGRRVIKYRSEPDDTDRATPRRCLHDRLVENLRVMVNQSVLTTRTPSRAAVDAIEQARPNRASVVRAAIKPGFPIWSWYPPPENRRRALIFLGSDARNPAAEGDTLWVRRNPSRFNSPSTGF